MVQHGDRNGDKKLSRAEMSSLADGWFDKLDSDKSGKLTQEQFVSRFGELLPPPPGAPGSSSSRTGRGFSGFVAGGFFTTTDIDRNGALERAEFKKTFEKWAIEFDTDRTGALTEEKLTAGLNSVLPRPNFGARPAKADDTTGFIAIFNGKTLEGWEGDPKVWRTENGEIVGQTTRENAIKVNTFLIWRAGTTRDFEFKVDFKLSEGANSGIQYRSALVPEAGKWTMKGYQADMDGANQFTGMIYEERGRGFLAPRGQFARVADHGETKLIGSLGEATELKAFIKAGDWNQLHIYANGNTVMQTINGHVMSGLIDQDERGRATEGLLGLQIHVGEPMKIQFKNLLFKKL